MAYASSSLSQRHEEQGPNGQAAGAFHGPGHCSQGGLLPTFQSLVAPAVNTLVQGILQARVDSCVRHWFLVHLTAWVSMKEASVEVRSNDTHIPNP